ADGFEDVLGRDVPTGGVVEKAVVALADDGEDDVLDVAVAGVVLDHPARRGVSDHADGPAVGEEDRRLGQAPLGDLRYPGDLVGAVEHERAGHDAIVEGVVAGEDRRDPGAHRADAGNELAAPVVEGDVPDLHAADVGDGVEAPGLIAADFGPELANP